MLQRVSENHQHQGPGLLPFISRECFHRQQGYMHVGLSWPDWIGRGKI
jgi:hypothetical protein